ncbi:hypothetical protein P3T29_000903 [Kitasatospora sp. MAP5-34]|nr:hypothetical protein [Kitasatospora sp. MAP5-34]
MGRSVTAVTFAFIEFTRQAPTPADGKAHCLA